MNNAARCCRYFSMVGELYNQSLGELHVDRCSTDALARSASNLDQAAYFIQMVCRGNKTTPG